MRAAGELAASWYHEFPEFGAAFRLLARIGENSWFLSQGGREAYRTLVDGLTNELNRATAGDWLGMIEFPTSALNWTEADEEHFSKTLEAYCESDVDDEISNCTTLDEMSELHNFLEKLENNHGLDLGRAISRLEDEMAQGEEPAEHEDERDFGGGHTDTREDAMSDDDVSEMFSTLRDSGPS